MLRNRRRDLVKLRGAVAKKYVRIKLTISPAWPRCERLNSFGHGRHSQVGKSFLVLSTEKPSCADLVERHRDAQDQDRPGALRAGSKRCTLAAKCGIKLEKCDESARHDLVQRDRRALHSPRAARHGLPYLHARSLFSRCDYSLPMGVAGMPHGPGRRTIATLRACHRSIRAGQRGLGSAAFELFARP